MQQRTECVLRLPKYPPFIGNPCRWIQWRRNFFRKLRNGCFCACAVKCGYQLSETLSNRKISIPLQEIDVAENDADNRFRTGSINNADSAHAQRKMAQYGRKRFPIAEIYNFCRWRTLPYDAVKHQRRRTMSYCVWTGLNIWRDVVVRTCGDTTMAFESLIG